LSGALSDLESLRFLVEITMATLGVPNANLNVGRKAPRFAFSRPKKPIPRDMAHLKNEMVMSNLLQEIYNISYHAEVKSMMIRERQVQPGDITGNLSESARVIVELELHNGEQHCYHWFVKILPKEHKNSELMHKFNIFENEIRFYKEIAPDLLRFLRDNGVNDVKFKIPKLLFADNREESAVIILEDVGEQGYGQDRDEDGERFLSKEKAHLAIKAIACIHAASKLYNLHNTTKLEEKHPNLQHNLMWEDTDFIDRLSAMKDSYCEVLKKSSEHDSTRLLQRFEKAFDSSMKLKSICAERYAPKQTNTAVYLQHGDFHFNNLLFKDSTEEGGDLEVMIVDWQLSYVGRSTGDLSYLLLSSISPKVRHENELVFKEDYYNSFNSYLKSFEASVMNKLSQNTCGISFNVACDDDDDNLDVVRVEVDDLEHDYQDSTPLSFFLSCGNVLNSDTSNTPDLSDDERDERTVNFAYNLVKDAAEMEII